MEHPNAGLKTNDPAIQFNILLRFAISASTYLAVIFVQLILNAVIYEQYIEHKIQQFTDLCTLSNISVWLMTEPRYGFYIHGRY